MNGSFSDTIYSGVITMSADNFMRALRAVSELGVQQAPQQHRSWTPDCLSLTRLEAGFREGFTPDEQKHVDACSYCQMIRKMHREIVQEEMNSPGSATGGVRAATMTAPQLKRLEGMTRVGRDVGNHLTPEQFWDTFVKVMQEPGISNFAAYYNNEQSKYRARNVRPRTDVMLKFKNSVLKTVLKHLKGRGFLPPGGATSTDRYIDLSYAVGDWWKAEKDFLVAVEVENSWTELRGTMLDLVRFQAKLKVAVFYASAPRQKKDEVRDALDSVISNFHKQGFEESSETSYLVVVAPDTYGSTKDAEVSYCIAYPFTGLNEVGNPNWLEKKLW
jgi:hypothetical protein